MVDPVEIVKGCRFLSEDFAEIEKGFSGYWPALNRYADAESCSAFNRALRELRELIDFLDKYANSVEKTVRDE